jgi:hypothetical protein
MSGNGEGWKCERPALLRISSLAPSARDTGTRGVPVRIAGPLDPVLRFVEAFGRGLEITSNGLYHDN